jgi:multiple sugar transport system permease protein
MRNKYHIGRWLVTAFIIVWSLFPVYWALNTSLTTTVAAQSVPPHFVPNPLVFDNYKQIFGVGLAGENSSLWPGFRQTMMNSIIEDISATIVTVLIAALAAFAFARMNFALKKSTFYVVLATMALPAYATLIPLYHIMSNLGLVNTYTGIVLVYVSGFLPLAMWILYTYFLTIPVALEEAAMIDGASRLATLWHVLLPLSLPGITTAAIITFLAAWGQFLFPLVLSSDNSTAPLTVFITSVQTQHIVPYTLLNSIGVMGIVVPALIVIFLNRYIVQGILAGSVK